jgi:carotenoid 1,2-hydratase
MQTSDDGPVSGLRLEHNTGDRRGCGDPAIGFPPSVSRQPRRALRARAPWLAGIISATGVAHENSGSLSGGRGSASGGGRADGSPIGSPGGGGPFGGPGFDRAVAKDGYVWWYVDGWSEDGQHALTIIAFVGSVFSPYYAAARRRGPADPDEFCALNVAFYENTRHYWVMTERPGHKVSRDATQFVLGPSALTWRGDHLEIAVREMTVPIPSRLRGTIRLYPGAVTGARFTLDPNNRHQWWPIAPASRIEVEMGKPALSWRGQAYFDSNAGDEPLSAAFRRWDWSRALAPPGQGVDILYDVEAKGGTTAPLVLHVSPDGQIEQRQSSLGRQAMKPGLWGVARSSLADPGGRAKILRTLEDSPFYTRSLISTQLHGKPVEAMHESLSLDRFDQRWVQILLPFRMPRF